MFAGVIVPVNMSYLTYNPHEVLLMLIRGYVYDQLDMIMGVIVCNITTF
jgi:hypothetical protein